MTRLKLVLFIAAAPLAFAAPAAAQMNMPGMSMPGMKMPAKKKPAAKKPIGKKPAAKQKSATAATSRVATKKRAAQHGPKHKASSAAPAGHSGHTMPAQSRGHSPANPHAGHDMSSMPGMQMPAQPAPKMPAGHDMSAMPGMQMPAKPAPKTPAGHDMSSMPGMQMPAQPPAAAPSGHDMQNMPGMSAPTQPSGAPGHDMSQMPGMQMPAGSGMPAGHDMGGMAGMSAQAPVGTDLPAGNAPAPPIPTDHAADRAYSATEMAEGRHHLQNMHGNQQFYQVMFNLAEYQARRGRDGYRWDGEAWYGGDINRLWLKSEGEGVFRQGVERGEVQALLSHAIGPYFNLQGGVRYDFQPRPNRVYAAVGVEGLAPSFFEVEGFLFLSNKGELLARAEAYYDQRITQRLILQPRAEFNFSAQDVRETGTGAGLSEAELGLRLRYDIRREFAPYVGIDYQREFGRTASFARARGKDPGGWNLVLGVRTWF